MIDSYVVVDGWRTNRSMRRIWVAGMTLLYRAPRLRSAVPSDASQFVATPLMVASDPESQDAGVIQPTPAPPGSIRTAMRPTPGTSKMGFISLAPAATAFFARASTSSTARYDIQHS